MPNVLTTNPVFVDTAAALVTAQHARIRSIVWDGAANGNTLVMHTASGGSVIFQARWATGDPATLIFNLGGVAVAGIYVTTIGGGTALIYLE